jgi:hypothetical protein
LHRAEWWLSGWAEWTGFFRKGRHEEGPLGTLAYGAAALAAESPPQRARPGDLSLRERGSLTRPPLGSQVSDLRRLVERAHC